MDRQGRVLKTLLGVAVVCTAAVGAPVQRDTCANTSSLIQAFSLPSITTTLCINTPQLKCEGENFTINIDDVDNYLQPLLLNDGLTRAVSEAENECFNNTGSEPRKCELAEAAIALQATIKIYVAEYRDRGVVFTPSIDCSTRDEEDMKWILCWASKYTKQILERVHVTV